MGFGAIVILVLLAALAMRKCSVYLDENDMAGVAAEALLFVINVGLMVWGNSWAWAAWQLAAVCKVAFFPSDELLDRAARMPPGYINLVMVITVLLNGGVYALFQWLR